MNIFVTGASGFVGASFIEKLRSRAKKTDHIFLLMRTKKDFSDKRFETLEGSLENIESFKNIILKCEYVFHIAANATFGDKADYDGINFIPTRKIVDILKDSKKLKDFIFISTIGAVDRHSKDDCSSPLNAGSVASPRSKYGESKLKSEECIRNSGIHYTIIRPTWVYGENMRPKSHINLFVTMAYKNNPIIKFNFPGKVSLIHVDDLSLSLVNCINNPDAVGKTYFAETESMSFGEIFNIIRRKVSKRDLNQLPSPPIQILIKKIHSVLPVPINNLFIDYLYVVDERFKAELLKGSMSIPFTVGLDDVMSTNIHSSGYWVITGANSGIGLALARKLKARGRRLILIDKNIDVISYEFSLNPSDVIIIKADLSESKQIYTAVAKIRNYPIYCLVNNAGIGYRKSFNDINLKEIKHILLVNIESHLLITKLLLDKLKKEGSVIVNIASSIAYNPLPSMLMYSSTKAFISNWSESLAYELKDTNNVITFSPSGTNTNFQNTANVKKGEEGKGLKTPEYVAEKIISAVRHNKTVVILDFKTNVLLMFSKFLPRKANIMLWGKLFEKMR